MQKLFLTKPRVFALFVALASSIGVVSATPANSATFKATIYQSPFLFFEDQEIEYTLADGIFDTIVSSPSNTFFTDQYLGVNSDPSLAETLATVVPEVVTELKWSRGGVLEPLEFEKSLFGITDRGLFLQFLNPSEGPYENILMATLQAPGGLPLSACKTQTCEGDAMIGGKGGYAGLKITQTPVIEVEPIPEPSAAVALGFVGALLLKRRRKALSTQPVATTAHE
jgi:hypothetical protein